jgi:ribosomal protein S18 acetylase RimI-like enzyme
MVATAHSIDQTLYLRADKSDAPEILALQKVAYQSDIEIYGDDSLPALQQSLEDLENDFDRKPNREVGLLGARGATDSKEAEQDRIVFLKAVVNGKIIGSVRGYQIDDTAHLTRMIVHPYFRGRGIGRRLLTEIEQVFPHAREFEAVVGHKSKRSLFQLEKRGYKVFNTEPFNPTISLVYLRKDGKSGPTAKPAADQPHAS